MSIRTFAAITMVTVLACMADARAAESGFYIGGSIGQASMELPSDPNFVFDEEDTAWKLFGGYNFDLGKLDLGVEVGYANLGEPRIGDATAFVGFETTAIEAFGVASLEAGPVDLFAKLGIVSWDAGIVIAGTDVPPEFWFSDSDTGTDAAYGLGVQWQLNQFGIRAEFEGFDIPDTDSVYMWSLGVTYSF